MMKTILLLPFRVLRVAGRQIIRRRLLVSVLSGILIATLTENNSTRKSMRKAA